MSMKKCQSRKNKTNIQQKPEKKYIKNKNSKKKKKKVKKSKNKKKNKHLNI